MKMNTGRDFYSLNLLSPEVVGPVSVCSSAIRIQNQITGSQVDVYAVSQGQNPRHIAAGIAQWSDQVFYLDQSITLNPGESIKAKQTIGTDSSPLSSDDDVFVQGMPPTVGYVKFKSHVFECGQCLWLSGMVPGAKVEVVTIGNEFRGSGIAYDGNARIGLLNPIGHNEVLVAKQIACGIVGLPTPGPISDFPARLDNPKLPTPIVESPLRACQRAVLVSGILDGI